MKKTMLYFAVVVLGCFLIFEPTVAQERRHRGFNISIDGDKGITDCAQVRIRFGDGETVRSQLVQSIPRSAISTRQVRSARNGGVQLQGWNRDEYSITACLAA